MEPEKVVAGVTQLIPESFVDVIRRVTPGVIFWLVLYFWTGFPKISPEGLGIAGLILFLFVSYATGLLLDAIGDCLTSSRLTQYAWKDFPEEGAQSVESEAESEVRVIGEILHLGRDDVVRPRDISKWKMPGLLRTDIIETNPRAAVVLPKLIAEELFMRNLAVGLVAVLLVMVLACLVRIHTSDFDWKHTLAFYVLIGAVAALAAAGTRYRAKRTVTRTREWFRLAHRGKF